MQKGNINAALNLLTNNMGHGILPLDQKTVSQLVLKGYLHYKVITSQNLLSE